MGIEVNNLSSCNLTEKKSTSCAISRRGGGGHFYHVCVSRKCRRQTFSTGHYQRYPTTRIQLVLMERFYAPEIFPFILFNLPMIHFLGTKLSPKY